jgi:hypothetical protein
VLQSNQLIFGIKTEERCDLRGLEILPSPLGRSSCYSPCGTKETCRTRHLPELISFNGMTLGRIILTMANKQKQKYLREPGRDQVGGVGTLVVVETSLVLFSM